MIFSIFVSTFGPQDLSRTLDMVVNMQFSLTNARNHLTNGPKRPRMFSDTFPKHPWTFWAVCTIVSGIYECKIHVDNPIYRSRWVLGSRIDIKMSKVSKICILCRNWLLLLGSPGTLVVGLQGQPSEKRRIKCSAKAPNIGRLSLPSILMQILWGQVIIANYHTRIAKIHALPSGILRGL